MAAFLLKSSHGLSLVCVHARREGGREEGKEGGREREREERRERDSSVSMREFLFVRTLTYHQAPSLRPHLTLNTSLMAASPNIATLNVRVSTYEFGRNTFSPLYRPNDCFLPKIRMFKPNSGSDGVWSWQLWGDSVKRVEPSWMGLVPSIE